MNYDNNGGADPDCALLPTNGSCIPIGDGEGAPGVPDSGQLNYCVRSAVKYASGLSDISGLNTSYVQVAQKPVGCLAGTGDHSHEDNGSYVTYNVSFSPKCTANDYKKCVGNSIYNFDTCDKQGTLYQACTTSQTCSNAACVNNAVDYGTFTLNYPNGGEQWAQGSSQTIRWTTTAGAHSAAHAQLTISNWGVAVAGYSLINVPNTGSYTLTVPNSWPADNAYHVWMGVYQSSAALGNPHDDSNNNFSVTATAAASCANGSTMTAPELSAALANGKVSITHTDSGSQVTYHITNTTKCSAPLIAATYKMFRNRGEANWMSTQQYYASSALVNINKTGTTDISVSNASCKTQADLWYQTAPHTLSDTQSYGNPNSLPWNLDSNVTSTSVCTTGTVKCSTNSQCGTDAYTGSLFCQSGNAYQNYITYVCNNAGTVNSSCSNSTVAKLKTTCTASQTCGNGSCVNKNIACSASADCGTNALTGNPFCQNNNVYRNQITYFCNEPGKTTSFCSNTLVPQLTSSCGTNKTCDNGSCSTPDIACGSNSDCGSNSLTGNAFCQAGNAYKNFITYSCNNPGKTTSFCSNSTTPQLTQTCSPNQQCTNGSCSVQGVACSTNSDCGASGSIGSLFCQNNNVYQNYKNYTCNSPGTASSFCSNATEAQLQTTCLTSQTCGNGTCNGNINTCTPNYQQRCSGSDLYWFNSCGAQEGLIQNCPNGCSNNACQNNNSYLSVQTNSATNVYNSQATLNGYLTANSNSTCNTSAWFQYGTSTNYGSETARQNIGSSGSFSANIYDVTTSNTYHFRAAGQDCSGNTVYGQDMTIYSNYSNGALSVSKTVRNLTSGSGWSTATYAAPSNMVMFMITLQATGNQNIQNVIVRDNLPANLVYSNQLVVACTGNYGSNNCNGNNYGYTGDITSGVNLGTIYAGQIVTITYQAQVGPSQNFSYGSTTLNNSAYVTSSVANTPTAIASVIVTRAGVLGASSISTGLTNNFWVDSFFLPLLITLLLLWMWRSGMFFWIEKFIDNKRKIKRTYKAEKELTARIAQIQKTGNR
jgi:fimbrial isopeptide formation D2 family protein